MGRREEGRRGGRAGGAIKEGEEGKERRKGMERELECKHVT